jgi:hypothetical protein
LDLRRFGKADKRDSYQEKGKGNPGYFPKHIEPPSSAVANLQPLMVGKLI